MSKNKLSITSEFYCTECGNKGIPIARKAGQHKEPGHLKKLYCLHCQKETNHAEIRPYGSYNLEDFEEEFRLGRFFEGSKIHVMNLMSCSKSDCMYNKHGKCWNSNYSYNCNYRLNKSVEEIRELFKNG